MSNAPTVLIGDIPPYRAVVRSSTSATGTTVTADDSGTLFVNLSTSAHTYTLPTVALGKGKIWHFLNAETTQTLAITGGSTDLIMGGADGNLADTITSAAIAGESTSILCDGTYYYALGSNGTWTASG